MTCNQSPTPEPSCRLRLNGTAAEQSLLSDLVTESIDIYGQDVYYINDDTFCILWFLR